MAQLGVRKLAAILHDAHAKKKSTKQSVDDRQQSHGNKLEVPTLVLNNMIAIYE